MGYSKTQRTRPGLDTQLMGAITILLLVDHSYILEQHLEFSVIYQFLWMPPTSNTPASQKPALEQITIFQGKGVIMIKHL